MTNRLEVCPMCECKGKQEIIDGYLCYKHGFKYCKWGKIANMEDVLDGDGVNNNEVLLFLNKFKF